MVLEPEKPRRFQNECAWGGGGHSAGTKIEQKKKRNVEPHQSSDVPGGSVVILEQKTGTGGKRITDRRFDEIGCEVIGTERES